MQAKYLLPFLFTAVQATDVLLPLYVYPSWEGWWDYIYETIAQNPDLDFDIIINPNDGPVGGNCNLATGCNSDWITGVSKLNSYPNVQLFGYVHTSYGGRSMDEINQDTRSWASWNTYTAANIAMGGIFFDEVPNWQGEQGQQDVAFMAEITDYAYELFDPLVSDMETIYNVGQQVYHAEYFDDDMADYVIVYENSAAAFSTSPDVLKDNVPAGQEAKSSLLIHSSIDADLPSSLVQQWLLEFSDAGIGSGLILDKSYNETNSKVAPADLGTVASVLAQG